MTTVYHFRNLIARCTMKIFIFIVPRIMQVEEICIAAALAYTTIETSLFLHLLMNQLDSFLSTQIYLVFFFDFAKASFIYVRLFYWNNLSVTNWSKISKKYITWCLLKAVALSAETASTLNEMEGLCSINTQLYGLLSLFFSNHNYY